MLRDEICKSCSKNLNLTHTIAYPNGMLLGVLRLVANINSKAMINWICSNVSCLVDSFRCTAFS